MQRQVERWAEHFGEQFKWPAVKEPILGTAETVWSVNTEEPTLEEVQREVSLLKHDEAPSHDGLHPTLFKEGGQSLITSLTKILRTVWTREQIPREWNHSTVIPVYKKGAKTCAKTTKASARLL